MHTTLHTQPRKQTESDNKKRMNDGEVDNIVHHTLHDRKQTYEHDDRDAPQTDRVYTNKNMPGSVAMSW